MNPTSDGPLSPGADGPKLVRRFQTDVRTLIVLVACCGLILWAGRRLAETHDPTSLELRAIEEQAIRVLQSGKATERVNAIRRVGGLGIGAGKVAVPPLTAALDDPEAEVRVAAAEALSQLGFSVAESASENESIKAAVTALIRRLKDPDPKVRIAVGTSLRLIASAKPVVATASPIDRKTVIDALVEMVRDRDAKVRHVVIHALASVGTGVPIVSPEALAPGLEDESAENRLETIRSLASFHRGLDPLIPTLLRLAEQDPDPSVRASSRTMLDRGLEPSAITSAVVPSLLEVLKSGATRVRIPVISLLGRLGPNAHEAIPELLGILNEPPDLRFARFPNRFTDPACEAALALGRIARRSARAKEVAAALIEVARSGPRSRRGWAVKALGQFGADAAEAVPILIGIIKNTSPTRYDFDGEEAASALGKIAPGTPVADQALTALLAVLTSNAWSKAAAIEALGHFGPKAAVAIPRIRALQDDPDPMVKRAAARALLLIEDQSGP